jgi:hypothetical protein
MTHRSLILETNSEIWKFSFQRVNELKTKPCLLGRWELWWQIGGQLSPKMVKSHKLQRFNRLKFSKLQKKWANGEYDASCWLILHATPRKR